MIELSTWAGRHVAAVALTLAYTIVGPQPGLTAAMERVYAVAIVGGDGLREGDPFVSRRPVTRAGWRPAGTRPRPVRP